LNLEGFVRFTGRIDDVPMWEYLATSDVGAAPDPVSPLNNISTMNKVMEYMAMGKPLVSFDLLESRYSAKEAAIYVPENNVQGFAQAIADLMDDSERRQKMGQYGLERISTQLCWEHSEENLCAAYRHALGTRAIPEIKSTS